MTNNIKELYAYREMIASLIKRELRGKYKASVLGILMDFNESIITDGGLYCGLFFYIEIRNRKFSYFFVCKSCTMEFL